MNTPNRNLVGQPIGTAAGPTRIGRFFLVVIGINTYRHWPELKTAVKGAEDLRDLLCRDYGFELGRELYEAQATRKAIVGVLAWLVDHVVPSDSQPGRLEWTEERVREVKATGALVAGIQGASVAVASGGSFTNSLGMRFVPVKTSVDGKKQVLFSIWPTRVQDYAEYAKANPAVDQTWKDPVWEGVEVTPEPTCPVVCVSWEDAKGFCAWLTQRDRAAGLIPASAEYRLPTDVEWSWAVGIGEAEEKAGAGRTPQEKDEKIKPGTHPYAYPWGKDWPPPQGAGNYADPLAKTAFPKFSIIEGYADGFATTSPVGSFPPIANGLYDLGGNTCEWCEDFYDGKSAAHVLRGSSWDDDDFCDLLSSCRSNGGVAGCRIDYYGFRLVLVC